MTNTFRKHITKWKNKSEQKGKRRHFLFPLRMPKMMVTSNIILINREIQTSLSTHTHTHTHKVEFRTGADLHINEVSNKL